MDKWEVYMEINQLLKQGFSKTKVAKKLGISRSTIYRYLKRNPKEMAEWMDSIQMREKKLDVHKDRILSWLRKHPDMNASQVYDWLLERDSSFEVSESTVRNYVRVLREEYQIPKETAPRSYEAVPDPPMGEQGQVDFGTTKNKKVSGGEIKLYFIAFVLSHSRYKYKRWLDRPFTTKDVIEAHELAFQWYGGMPNELVYDQDNLIVVSENGGDLILTEEFQTYRDKRGFNMRVCKKADPESKGKIENVVGFVKSNFAKHRVFHTIDSFNDQGVSWLNRTGNAKVHNTTKKRPAEVFLVEKQHLKPVPNMIHVHQTYDNSIARSVRKDNTVRYLANRYSLPLGTFHKHKEVLLLETDDQELVISSMDGGILARHVISLEKGKLILDRQHQRDRSKGINAYIQSVASCFENDKLAAAFLEKIREKYPRYVRDQLQMVARQIDVYPAALVQAALEECMKRKLYSATDFSDVISYLERQRVSPGTSDHSTVTKVPPSPLSSSWVMETQAGKRDMDAYYAILEGDGNQ